MKKSILLNFLFLAVLFIGSATAQTGGPDAYGYTWAQKRAATGSKWIEIVKPLRPGAIDITENLSRSKAVGPINFSFEFPYYWYTHNSFYISRTGYVSFEENTLGAGFDPIPQTGGQGNDIIAPFLGITQMEEGATNIVFWSDFKDSIIVTWNEMRYSSPNDDPFGAINFQVVMVRETGEISFNYNKKEGSFNATSCESLNPAGDENCQVIGIENNSGQVGLLHSIDDETVFLGVTAADPLTITYLPSDVENMNYTTTDLGIKDILSEGTKGLFFGKDRPKLPLKTTLKNYGIEKSRSIQLNGIVRKGNAEIVNNVKLAPAIEKDMEATILFPSKFDPNELGRFSFETVFDYEEDEYQPNNQKRQLFVVVDTTQDVINLDYTAKIGGSDISWTTTVPYQRGNAMYYEPPFYPVIIKTFNFMVGGTGGAPQPTDNVMLQVIDDNGLNVFGEKDGSPGDVIWQKEAIPTEYAFGTYNQIEVDQEIQINSGGVYLTTLQGGRNQRFATRTSTEPSRRSLEFRGGSFSPFRFGQTQDFVIGMDVTKGDEDQVTELELTEIISPLPSDVITEDATVTIKMTNVGPQAVTGPIDVYFMANANDEINELIENVDIPIGGELEYTFTIKAKRPNAPKTQYESFCVRMLLPNDFDLTNNKKCYQTSVGIKENNTINNLIVFPNPTKGDSKIIVGSEIEDDLIIHVADLTGKIHWATSVSIKSGMHKIEIPTDKLSKGIYFVKVMSENGIRTQRLIKQ
ncbi:MAG: hypothetical protein ACJATA_001946 [Sphingobacteriales bacterium]|jgi:hypothetical protein